MGSQPLVSVVINFLNAEAFLGEAIESVAAQTWDDWELLLVDDGSDDGSTETALRYAIEYPGKVRYLEHEGHRNLGAGASRSLGSGYGKGRYVAFLDADDIWMPRKLEQQVAILESRPQVGMVYGPALYWNSWAGDPDDEKRDFLQKLGVPANMEIPPPRILSMILQDEGTTPLPSCMMVRRSTDREIGGFEKHIRSIFDDQVYCVKLGLKTPVWVSDKCWIWYRQHPDQRCTITAQTGQYPAVRLEFLKWVRAYLSENEMNEPDVWRSLEKALRPFRYRHLRYFLRQLKRWVGERGR